MNISDNYCWKSTKKRHNSPLLPSNIRGLIIGKSNSGKTVLLLNLLLQECWLDYDHLYIYGNSLHQKEYQVLQKGFQEGLSKRQLSNLFQKQQVLQKENISPFQVIEEYSGIREGGIKVTFYENCEDIPDPKNLNPNVKNLLILDDCYLGKQSKPEAYYTRGRHNNCDIFYISQNYFRLPRQSIRENSNFIILFEQDTRNLDFIYSDHCTDIMKEEFKAFCKKV